MNYYQKALLILLLVFISTVTAKQQLPIEKTIEDTHRRTGVGAVAYVLVENGKLISAGGFGQYSLQDKTPVDQNSLFRIGSITKTFTAIAIMQQVEKGKLKLNSTINSILKTNLLHNPFNNKPVTLEMLLEHTSGLQDLTRKEFDYPIPLKLSEALMVAPEARIVKTPPGDQFNYSNVGAGYLGRAIEVVNEVDYDDWFESTILLKMGMTESSLRWNKKTESKLVTGYDSDLKTPISYWHTLFRPFGGMNTTAMDMRKLLKLLTAPRDSSWNQIITPESIERMETPTTSLASVAGMREGYGLAIRNEVYKGFRLYGHGGDGDGYLAQFSYSKESGRGYFFVINAFRHDIKNNFTRILDNWLIEKINRIKYQKNNFVLSPTQIKTISGEYQISTSRFPRKNRNPSSNKFIRTNNGVLQICNKRITICKNILPQSENLFISEEDYFPSTFIGRADDGNIYMQDEEKNYRHINQH